MGGGERRGKKLTAMMGGRFKFFGRSWPIIGLDIIGNWDHHQSTRGTLFHLRCMFLYLCSVGRPPKLTGTNNVSLPIFPNVDPVAMSLFRRPHRLPFAARRHVSTSVHPHSTPWRTGAYAALFALSAGTAAVYYLDARSALHRYVLTPVIRSTLDAETSHKLAVKVLRSGFGPTDPVLDDPRLSFEVCIFLPALDVHKVSQLYPSCGVNLCQTQWVSPLVSTKTGRPLMV